MKSFSQIPIVLSTSSLPLKQMFDCINVCLFSSKTDMVGGCWSKAETYGCEYNCGRESYLCL